MKTTDYSGMFIYKDDHIDYIQTSEGRMKWDDQHHLFYAEYFIKDHLGNVRSVVTSNPGQTLAIQGTDYYPFGLEIQNINASDNLQLYNSKELQTDAKLWWYDYGARFYDPVLARWHSVDPMAETSRRWSPYAYCMNNPIRFIDPDGMLDTKFQDENGKTLYETQDNVDATVTVSSEKVEEFNSDVSYFENDGLVDPQEEKQKTVELASQYMQEGSAMWYSKDNQGNISNLGFGDAPLYQVNQAGFRVAGGVGTTFTLSAGLIWDSKGNAGFYGSAGVGVGVDGSIGPEYTKNVSTNSDFNIKSLEGPSNDVSVGGSIIDFSKGGNANGLFKESGSDYKSGGIGLSGSAFQVAVKKQFEVTGVARIIKGK